MENIKVSVSLYDNSLTILQLPTKTHVVVPHEDNLTEEVLTRSYNIMFYA